MKGEKFILTYLLCLLTWLPQSQHDCINRPRNADRQSIDNNLNLFEIIREVRNEMNAEKKRVRRSCDEKNFLGSNLFDGIRKKCFTVEEINLLTARMEFENMIPIKMPPVLLNDRQIRTILRYFCYGHFLIANVKKKGGNHIIKKAFYDTLGGFLHSYLIPIAKASFYAGRVKMETVLKVIAHYEKCRRLLNTNGNGWRAPNVDPLHHLDEGCVKPLRLEFGDLQNEGEKRYCAQLNFQSGSRDVSIIDEMMLVGLPKIEIEDSDGYLGNIYLPLDRKRTFNLRSSSSAGVLIDFYKTVIACYKEKCMSPKVYKCNLREWIKESVQAHLNDEVFYPGLGSVLNLYEALRSAGKKKSKKLKAISCGERQKRCRGDINEAIRKHKCKTLKFINLESKASQCQMDDECEKNWLKDPRVNGIPKPKTKCDPNKKTGKKGSSWFSRSWSNSEKAEKENDKKQETAENQSSKTTDKENKKSKKIKDEKNKENNQIDEKASNQKNEVKDYNKANKDKNKQNEDDKDNDEKKSEGSFWRNFTLDRLYKKGSWGFVFPRLKGLGFFSKLWEIFKFLFFLIFVTFLLVLIFKALSLCTSVSAGPLKCFEYFSRALVDFGKIFYKVVSSICACTSSCWRLSGGQNAFDEESGQIEKVVIIPLEKPNPKSKTKKENIPTSKVPPPAEESKPKNRTKKDKMSKSLERAASAHEPGVEEPTKRFKDKRGKKTRKEETLALPPPKSLSALQLPERSVKESKKKSKVEMKFKKYKRSKSEEPSSVEKIKNEKIDKGKKHKELEKKSRKSKQHESTTSEEEDKQTKKKSCLKVFSKKSKEKTKESKEAKQAKSKESRTGRNGKRKTGTDSAGDEGSERLLGGQSYPDWYTDLITDCSEKNSNECKSSWKTFYDF